jgi:hypothetical protein
MTDLKIAELESEIASLRDQLQWSIKNERQLIQIVVALLASLAQARKELEKAQSKDSPL